MTERGDSNYLRYEDVSSGTDSIHFPQTISQVVVHSHPNSTDVLQQRLLVPPHPLVVHESEIDVHTHSTHVSNLMLSVCCMLYVVCGMLYVLL